MIQQIRAPKALKEGSYEVLMFANVANFRNALLTMLRAIDPYLFLGRIGKTATLSVPITGPESKGSKNNKVVIEQIGLGPGLGTVLRNLSFDKVISDLLALRETEGALARQVHPSTLPAEITRYITSVPGYSLYHLVNAEVGNAIPIPLSKAMAEVVELQSLSSLFISSSTEGSFKMGTEADIYGTPVYIQNLTDETDLDCTAVLDQLLSMLQGPTSLLGADERAREPRLTSFDLYSYLDLVLAFRKPEDIRDAIEAAAAAVDVTLLAGVLKETSIEHYKRVRAANVVMYYFLLAPIMRRLKAVNSLFHLPFFSEFLVNFATNPADHDRVKAALAYIESFKLPFAQNELDRNMRNVGMAVGDISGTVDLIETADSVHLSSLNSYMDLMNPANLPAKLIRFITLMEKSSITDKELSAVSGRLGLSPKFPGSKIVVNTSSDIPITYTDGHRASGSVGDYADVLRQHFVTVADEFKPRMTVTYKSSKPLDLTADVVGKSLAILGAKPDQVMFGGGNTPSDDILRNLVDQGMLGTVFSFFKVERATLNRTVQLNLDFERASVFAPIERIGLPGSKDVTIRIETAQQLVELMGYFNTTFEDVIQREPALRKFVSPDGSFYKFLVKGETPRQMALNSLVSLRHVGAFVKTIVFDRYQGRSSSFEETGLITFINVPVTTEHGVDISRATEVNLKAGFEAFYHSGQIHY